MKRYVLLTLTLASLLLAAGAAAADPSETIRLGVVGGSHVSGTATVGAAGAGSVGSVALRGLAAGARFRALLHAGSCKLYGASSTLVASGRAHADGTARTPTAPIRFRGAAIAFATIADGGHVVTVVSGGKVVACGVIPGMS